MKSISNYREFTKNPNDISFNDELNVVCKDKDTVLRYLKKFDKECIVLTCASTDFVTGKLLKSSIFVHNYGVYCWTNEEIYHFEKYNMKLNDDFIQYVLDKAD
nr:hypothetical protein [uncultured Ruminococcus sp.]